MGPGGFFPTNPDLANILGRTDFDFENFIFFFDFWVPNFWLGPTLGPAWARLGPGLGPGLGAGLGLGLPAIMTSPGCYQPSVGTMVFHMLQSQDSGDTLGSVQQLKRILGDLE